MQIPVVDISGAPDISAIETLARHIRMSVIELSHRAGTPHLGSSLSCTDILAAAYGGTLNISKDNHQSAERDRFILSKGHAATALYSALAFQGFFDVNLLDTYALPGSTLAEQPSPQCQPGVEAATGSLGHGLSLGVGMALAGRINKHDFSVTVLMSDGECNEGSVWEAALFCPAQKLTNVQVIIDFNKWQATGRSEEVMALSPFADKWRSFGWEGIEIDGHDIETLVKLLSDKTPRKQPRAIIANTIKGKGVSFMQDDNNWHYRIPSSDEVAKARVELGL